MTGEALFRLCVWIPGAGDEARVGDACCRTDTRSARANRRDRRAKRASFGSSWAMQRGVLPEWLSIGPAGPIDTGALQGSAVSVRGQLIAGDGRYAALAAAAQGAPAIRGLPRVAGDRDEGDVGAQASKP